MMRNRGPIGAVVEAVVVLDAICTLINAGNGRSAADGA
jgi:hypothetical protein